MTARKTPAGSALTDRILNCLRKHPDWPDTRVANAMRCHIGPVREARRRSDSAARKTPTGLPQKAAPQSGLTKAEFMAAYDPTTKMRLAIKTAAGMITKGRFYRDHELRKMAGYGGGDTSLWRSIAADPDEGFVKYQFRMGDQIWWSDPVSVTDMIATHAKAKEVE